MSCFSFLKRGGKNSYDVTSPYDQSYSSARYSVHSNNLRYSSVHGNHNEEQGHDHMKVPSTTTTTVTTETAVRNDKPRQIQAAINNDENSNQQKTVEATHSMTKEEVRTDSRKPEDVSPEESLKVQQVEECHEDPEEVEEAAVGSRRSSDVEQHRHHAEDNPETEVEMQTAAHSVESRAEETWQQEENEEHELDSTAGTWDSRPNSEVNVISTTTDVRIMEAEDQQVRFACEEPECRSISSGEHENERSNTDDEREVHARIVDQTESGVSVIQISSAEEGQEVKDFQHSDQEEREYHSDYEEVEGPASVVQGTITSASRGDSDAEEEEDDNRQNEENEFLSTAVVVTADESYMQEDGSPYSTGARTTTEGTNGEDFNYTAESSAMVY